MGPAYHFRGSHVLGVRVLGSTKAINELLGDREHLELREVISTALQVLNVDIPIELLNNEVPTWRSSFLANHKKREGGVTVRFQLNFYESVVRSFFKNIFKTCLNMAHGQKR